MGTLFQKRRTKMGIFLDRLQFIKMVYEQSRTATSRALSPFAGFAESKSIPYFIIFPLLSLRVGYFLIVQISAFGVKSELQKK